MTELTEKELMENSGGSISLGLFAVGLCGFGIGVAVGFLAIGALYYVTKKM